MGIFTGEPRSHLGISIDPANKSLSTLILSYYDITSVSDIIISNKAGKKIEFVGIGAPKQFVVEHNQYFFMINSAGASADQILSTLKFIK